ncbi:carboxypeptidase-like regulatory domain-containing protein [Parabacteroides sp. FAFU027]|uniref:carboxypeptidase-like regulatory domain-containing protein n=1 Tax=Parabacteroides sp. FAFU027 TaxID=2922715 RepID=UPI001FB019FB|nr:carboxypeptidase-like regulatory domain-containing protein [Parabacteroides sp. FAFU027]
MKGRLQAKLNMYLALCDFLKKNPEITAKIPGFTDFMADLDAAILLIQAQINEQNHNPAGKIVNSQVIKESVVDITQENADKIYAYAKISNNATLLAETKFTVSDLRRLSIPELINVSNNLYNHIDEHLEYVGPFFLNSNTQSAFKATINSLFVTIPGNLNANTQTKEYQFIANQGFEAAETAIENMDTVIKIIRTTEPVFYNSYLNARKIKEPAISSLSAQGTVTDVATGKPVIGATLTFRLQGTTDIVLQKESAAKGGFMIKSLDDGIYEVTIEKVGFKTKTIIVTVSWDELCNINVELEKIVQG